MSDSNLLEILGKFLRDDEQLGYDSSETVFFALENGTRRNLKLPKKVQEQALRVLNKSARG